MRWIIVLVLALILVNSASAVIKNDASIITVNDKEAKFMLVDYANNAYSTKTLYTSKFYDWKDLTLADIDADDYNELIVLRDVGTDVYVYDYIDQELVQKFDPRSIGSFAKDLDWLKIIPINLDTDKEDELLLVNNRYGRFYYLDNSGSTLNAFSFGETLFKDWISIEPGDVDQDGKTELIMLRRNTQPVYVLEINNKQLNEDFNLQQTKKLGDSIGEDVSAMAVGDLNNDGKQDIIVADTNGKLYSVSYSNVISILTQTSFKHIEDMDIADVDSDGKNELVVLKSYPNPISVYKFYGEALTEYTVKTLTGEVGWIGISAGNFKSEVSAQVPAPETEENRTEILTDADSDGIPDTKDDFPNDFNEWSDKDDDRIGDNSDNCISISNLDQLDSDENGVGDACETKIVEKQSPWIYVLIILLIIVITGAVIFFYKFIPKSGERGEKPSKKDDKIYLESEERESMWPVSKRSKDIRDLKELVKKTKK